MRNYVSVAREEVAAAAVALYNRGLNSNTSGNVSARAGEVFAITPAGSTGILKGNIRPEEVSVVTMDGVLIEGPKNSSEWRVHATIYKNMPEINAVAHPHPPYVRIYTGAVAEELGNMYRGIEGIIPKMCIMFGEAGYYLGADNPARLTAIVAGKSGSQDLANMVLAEIMSKGVSTVVMFGHGTIAIGENMAEALGRAEELEVHAKIAFEMRQDRLLRKGRNPPAQA